MVRRYITSVCLHSPIHWGCLEGRFNGRVLKSVSLVDLSDGLLITSAHPTKAASVTLIYNLIPAVGDNWDVSLWHFTSNRQFSVSSFYSLLNWGACYSATARILWKVKAPLKVRAFTWLTARHAILTRDNLSRRNWEGPLGCVLYSHATRSVNHLLFHCHFSLAVLTTIKASFGITTHPPLVSSLWIEWRRKKVKSRGKTLWDVMVIDTCWTIWREMINARILNNKICLLVNYYH